MPRDQALAASGLLVIWGGEFGRSSVIQGKIGSPRPAATIIRAASACGWPVAVSDPASMVRPTDFLFNVAEGKVHIHDVQATILHLMGLDHEALSYRYPGRAFRLTDVHGHVVKGILA